MTSKRKIHIPKEKAVFRMDANGNWHNEHGKFEHPRITKYFHASIRKDDLGYHVFQSTDEFEEKVYFPYEDTPIFAIDIELTEDVPRVVLNTTEKLPLDPEALSTANDTIYMRTPDHRIKFTSKALLKLSKYMEETENGLVLNVNGRIYPIV